MSEKKRCLVCGGEASRIENGQVIVCQCWKFTFTTSSSTMAYDFNEQLRNMHNWKATFHGRIDGAREPVPQTFQDAFKDGELEV